MKLIHLWRNFSFLHMFHVQKFEISPDDRFFLHGHRPCVRDKYQVCIEYTKENSKYANQNTKYAKQNTKYAKQNTKYDKQNIKYVKQNTKYAISIKRVRQKLI